MTTAYWCVLAMIAFPYLFTILAKTGPGFSNYDPRGYLERVTGWRRRAHHVQQNSFEALSVFGFAVIIAHLAHAPQMTLDKLALTFVVARILYGICYLTNKAALRTLFWAVGMACVIAMFCITGQQ